MARAFISVGSNIEPEVNVRKALHLLEDKAHIVAISTFYHTKPQDRSEQPFFYNGIVEIETDIPPIELKWSVLRSIEEQLGRRRTMDKNAPRTIDLDLIIYDDLVLKTDDLTLPDPQIQDRPYLAIPLFELAGDMPIPDSDISLKKIVANLAEHDMQPLSEYTEMLKKDLIYGLRESRTTR